MCSDVCTFNSCSLQESGPTAKAEYLTWFVGFKRLMCQAVDDICHSDIGVEPSVVGHLRFFHVCAVPNGIDVVIAFQLEVLVNFQSSVTCQFVPCFAKQSLQKEFCDVHCGLRPQKCR